MGDAADMKPRDPERICFDGVPHLVFTKIGSGLQLSLWALPFSLETLQPSGEAFPIAGTPSILASLKTERWFSSSWRPGRCNTWFGATGTETSSARSGSRSSSLAPR